MIGRFPIIEARASLPFAAPNNSSQGRVLMRRLQSWVQEAEQPESTVATVRGREDMDCDAALNALVMAESAEVEEQTSLEELSLSNAS